MPKSFLFFVAFFKRNSGAQKLSSGAEKRNSSAQKHKYKECLIEFCKTPRTAKEISRHLGFKSKNYVREKIIKPLLQTDILEFTNKEVRNARNQKYKIKTK